MSSRKRDREVELENESVTPTSTNKCRKLDDADPAGSTCDRMDSPNGIDECLLILWSRPITEEQKIFLVKKMEELVRLKSAADFIKPHSERHVSFYAKRIKGPLDLSTMRSLLNTGGYSSVTDLVTDFRIMISNVMWIRHGKIEESAAARRLLKCFHERMSACPTGLDKKPMSAYSGKALKIMALEVLSSVADTTTQVTNSPSEELEVISIDDSDASECDEVAGESDIDDFDAHDLERPPHVAVYSSTSWPEAAKTPEPDDLDEETQQLQKEMKECQQKLANMAEKKRLLTEIKDMDTERATIDGQIPETKRQAEQLESKIQDTRQMIDALDNEGDPLYKAGLWHRQQSQRLQQESERCRQEDERLRPTVNMYIEKVAVLHLERNQMEKQSSQVAETDAQLKKRRDEIENQRAIAKKKFDELSNGSI
jgi:hypothetical protein